MSDHPPEAPRTWLGTPHRILAVEEITQVGEARRAAQAIAIELGMDEPDAGRVTLVVSELATNLVRYARGGRIALRALDAGVEVISIDDGPGMRVAACLEDGHSTGAGRGEGLGAVRRASDGFDAWSDAAVGTVVWSRVLASSARRVRPTKFAVGGMEVPHPGERVSGDGWLVHTAGDVALVTVVDGLGHGDHAHVAAATFLRAVEREPDQSLAVLTESLHRALRATRGAAAALVRIDLARCTGTLVGVGNVSVEIHDDLGVRSCVSQHGILGAQLRTPREEVFTFSRGASLVMYSDGLSSRTRGALPAEVRQAHPAIQAALLWSRGARGTDDATAVVVREAVS